MDKSIALADQGVAGNMFCSSVHLKQVQQTHFSESHHERKGAVSVGGRLDPLSDLAVFPMLMSPGSVFTIITKLKTMQ